MSFFNIYHFCRFIFQNSPHPLLSWCIHELHSPPFLCQSSLDLVDGSGIPTKFVFHKRALHNCLKLSKFSTFPLPVRFVWHQSRRAEELEAPFFPGINFSVVDSKSRETLWVLEDERLEIKSSVPAIWHWGYLSSLTTFTFLVRNRASLECVVWIQESV